MYKYEDKWVEWRKYPICSNYLNSTLDYNLSFSCTTLLYSIQHIECISGFLEYRILHDPFHFSIGEEFMGRCCHFSHIVDSCPTLTCQLDSIDTIDTCVHADSVGLIKVIKQGYREKYWLKSYKCISQNWEWELRGLNFK